MKIVKKVISIIIYIIISIISIYSLYNFICINILHKDLVPVFGYASLEVVSGSMEPTIKTGDLIIIDLKEKEFHENDIVTFYDTNGAFVTHRILSISDNEMLTKGDNNNTDDGNISTDKIVGKYVTRLNNVGRILSSFKSPITLLLILVIGILVCVYISIDKDGKPIMTKEEQEFEEFLEYKKNNKRSVNAKKTSTTKPKKETKTKTKKATVKKANVATKKTTNKKTTTSKKTTKNKETKKSTKTKNKKK